MSSKSTYSLFQDLEKSLRSLVGTEESSDYDKLATYLGLAKDVHILGEKFRTVSGLSSDNQRVGFQSPVTAQHQCAESPTPNIPEVPEAEVAPGSPIYFIYKDELVKLGATSSKDNALYKKVVSLSEVGMICRILSHLLSASPVVSVADIKNELGPTYPNYRIQITLMALVSIGVMAQVGRGKYSLGSEVHQTPSHRDLIASLEMLPVNEHALALIDSQRKKS